MKIKVIIGRIGDLHIDNTSALLDSRLLAYVKGIRPGQLIESQHLEKTLLALNDIPGLKVTASMQPGKRRGSADLMLKVFDLEREGNYLSYDNYGSKSTGRSRFGIEFHYNNLTNVGDQISLSGMTSTDDLHNVQLRYSVPVGSDGASLHLTAGQMNYVLGGQYDYLNADGLTNTYELGIAIPVRRTYAQSLFYSVNVRHRDIHDYILSGTYGTEKASDSIEGDLYGLRAVLHQRRRRRARLRAGRGGRQERPTGYGGAAPHPRALWPDGHRLRRCGPHHGGWNEGPRRHRPRPHLPEVARLVRQIRLGYAARLPLLREPRQGHHEHGMAATRQAVLNGRDTYETDRNTIDRGGNNDGKAVHEEIATYDCPDFIDRGRSLSYGMGGTCCDRVADGLAGYEECDGYT